LRNAAFVAGPARPSTVQSSAGLESLYRRFGFGAVDAVDADAQLALEQFHLAAGAARAQNDAVFGRRRRFRCGGDGIDGRGPVRHAGGRTYGERREGSQ